MTEKQAARLEGMAKDSRGERQADDVDLIAMAEKLTKN